MSGNKRNEQLTTNGLSKIYRLFTFGSLRVCSANLTRARFQIIIDLRIPRVTCLKANSTQGVMSVYSAYGVLG